MTKKIAFSFVAVIFAFAVFLFPLNCVYSNALEVSNSIPTHELSIPLEVVSFRLRGSDGNLHWFNFTVPLRVQPDTESITTFTADNGDYAYFPPNVEISMHTVVENGFAVFTFYFPSSISANNSYVNLTTSSIYSTQNDTDRYVYVKASLNGSGRELRTVQRSTTLITFNNATRQILTQRINEEITPTNDANGRFARIYPDSPSYYNINSSNAIKCYYNTQIDRFSIMIPYSTITALQNIEDSVNTYIYGSFGATDPTTIPSDWFGWILDGVNGFMSFQILPNVSLWVIFYGVMGFMLFVFIYKKFAGG